MVEPNDMPLGKPNRRHFTDAARAAAAEARRRKREMAVPRDTLDVFVVRLSETALRFGWEIRRFGGVVLDQSRANYAEAEREGKVGRPCGAEFMTTSTHAHLLQEGELKGWLAR